MFDVKCSLSGWLAVLGPDTIVHSMAQNRVTRGAYLTLGFVTLGLGMAGTILPLIPTTPFVLLAAFAFARSSPRFERWLLEHRVFGPIIRDWRVHRGFSMRAKIAAVIGIVVTFSITIGLAIQPTPLRIGLAILAIGLIWFITSRPTTDGLSRLRPPRRAD